MNALTLPDIAAQASRQTLPLEWVGMCGIALPVLLDGQRLSATADAGVSLDDGDARGIHMSRLYQNAMFHVELKIDVAYSSTCPCSAALSRQLIQQQFIDDFAHSPLLHADVLAWLGSTKGVIATPHSQRSTAQLHLHLDDYVEDFPLIAIINDAEAALGTAVQTAVKRADEQAFALANGQNLMFCEDAVRRLNLGLKRSPGIRAFHLRVIHAESLHAHDAVAESRWNGESA
ncbi:GTP cyclohydrolase, FolE2/MptA family [Rhodococcus sp. IEGM1300]